MEVSRFGLDHHRNHRNGRRLCVQPRRPSLSQTHGEERRTVEEIGEETFEQENGKKKIDSVPQNRGASLTAGGNEMAMNENRMENTMKHMGDRIFSALANVGQDAWDELKGGIDKAWQEIRMGIDDGLDSASQGINKAWTELAGSIERAKDSLLMNQQGGGRSEEESEQAPQVSRSSGSSKSRKEKLS
jgi:hypothetical protein